MLYRYKNSLQSMLCVLGLGLGIHSTTIAQLPAPHQAASSLVGPKTDLLAWFDFEKDSLGDASVSRALHIPVQVTEQFQQLKAVGVKRGYFVSDCPGVFKGNWAALLESSNPQGTADHFRAMGTGIEVRVDGNACLLANDKAYLDQTLKSHGQPSETLAAGLNGCKGTTGVVFGVPQDRSQWKFALQLMHPFATTPESQELMNSLMTANFGGLSGEFQKGSIKGLATFDQAKNAAAFSKSANSLLATLPAGGDLKVVNQDREASLQVSGTEKIGAILKGLGVNAVSQDTNNFRQIMLAIHNHEAAYQRLPPQALVNKDGKRLLSWRVLLLPFLEESELYQQFHLDEAWDSPHNIKLVEKIPAIYRSSTSDLKPGLTRVVAPLTAGSLFGRPGDLLKFQDITDGTSSTLAIAEAAPDKAVIWTKPEDIVVDLKAPLKSLLGEPRNEWIFGMLDGSVRTEKGKMSDKTFLELLSIQGGEVIDFESF